MPLSMFSTFYLGKIRTYSVVLQMADRTRVVPKEIIEDVLIYLVSSLFLLTLLFLIMIHMIGYQSYWNIHSLHGMSTY